MLTNHAAARVAAGVILVALGGPGGARAQDVDTGAGYTLARQWCAECHDIRRGGLASRNLDAPPFSDLVENPAMTEIAIRALLRRPHATMPNIQFTAEQMDQIVAYLLSLRRAR